MGGEPQPQTEREIREGMSLPSYKKDPLGEVEGYRGGRDVQPTPFRANQLIQQDKNKRGPLQRYELPTPKFWHKHSRALTAMALGSFIIIYTGFKIDAFNSGEAILKK